MRVIKGPSSFKLPLRLPPAFALLLCPLLLPTLNTPSPPQRPYYRDRSTEPRSSRAGSGISLLENFTSLFTSMGFEIRVLVAADDIANSRSPMKRQDRLRLLILSQIRAGNNLLVMKRISFKRICDRLISKC